MGFLDQLRQVAAEVERQAAEQQAASLQRLREEMLRQMEPTAPGSVDGQGGREGEGLRREPLGSRAGTDSQAQPRRRGRGVKSAPLATEGAPSRGTGALSRTSVEPASTGPDPTRPSPLTLPLTVADLPRAMILKEILGPPPGLSDDPW